MDDTALQSKINAAIAGLKADGTYQKILDRYTRYGLVDPEKQ